MGSVHEGLRVLDLFALLAAQDRKVVLIDSVERLLESSTRGALSDLLTIARRDPGLTVILTCRDYATETVRSALLAGVSPQGVKTIRVPPLDDDHLA